MFALESVINILDAHVALRQLADHELAFVVHAVNNRPCKCLDHRGPVDVAA